MIFKMALLGNLLLASGALALNSPSSPLGAPLVRRGDSESLPGQSLSLSSVESRTIYNTVQSSSWAGVRVHANHGDNITYVTGTFTIPNIFSDNSSVSIWIGFDGAGCPNSALRAGVNLFVNREVFTSSVWYQFVASGVYGFPGITVSAGDEIRITLVAVNATWGVVMIDNLTAAECNALDVFPQAPQTFCLESAEWIVGCPGVTGSFANFDNVTFTTAMAAGTYTTYTPSEPASGVIFYDLVLQTDNSNRTLLTFVNAAGSSLLVQRLQDST